MPEFLCCCFLLFSSPAWHTARAPSDLYVPPIRRPSLSPCATSLTTIVRTTRIIMKPCLLSFVSSFYPYIYTRPAVPLMLHRHALCVCVCALAYLLFFLLSPVLIFSSSLHGMHNLPFVLLFVCCWTLTNFCCNSLTAAPHRRRPSSTPLYTHLEGVLQRLAPLGGQHLRG